MSQYLHYYKSGTVTRMDLTQFIKLFKLNLHISIDTRLTEISISGLIRDVLLFYVNLWG